jgi:hypothetical protein
VTPASKIDDVEMLRATLAAEHEGRVAAEARATSAEARVTGAEAMIAHLKLVMTSWTMLRTPT